MKKTIRCFAFVVFIIALSCEQETPLPEEEIPSSPVAVLKNAFSLENFDDPAGTIKNNLQIQWENHTTKTIAGVLWYEFGIIQQQKADMVSPFQEDNHYKLLASLDESGSPYYFIAKLAPQKWVSAPQGFSYFDPTGFSGTVSLYNIQGEVIFLEYYKKGQVQSSVQDISIKGEPITPISNKCMQKGTAMAKCDTALDCAFYYVDGESTGDGCGGGNTGGSYIAVRTDHYTDWYNIRGDGTADYSHTQFNGSTYEYVYVPDATYSSSSQNAYTYYNYTGHGEYGTGDDDGYYTDTPPVNEVPERIITTDLKHKEGCLNNLLLKSGENYIDQILQHFEGESEFDIKIKSEDKVFSTKRNKYVNGQTKYTTGQNTIYIAISTDKISTMPALAAAKTLIHEYIHADIFRKLNTKYPTNGELDFRETFEKYEEEEHHNAMADLYVNTIKEALKDFHKNVLVGDYNYLTNNGTNPLPDSFYEALAWLGLKENNVKAYTDLSDAKKAELTNSLNMYYHSTTKNCPDQ